MLQAGAASRRVVSATDGLDGHSQVVRRLPEHTGPSLQRNSLPAAITPAVERMLQVCQLVLLHELVFYIKLSVLGHRLCCLQTVELFSSNFNCCLAACLLCTVAEETMYWVGYHACCHYWLAQSVLDQVNTPELDQTRCRKCQSSLYLLQCMHSIPDSFAVTTSLCLLSCALQTMDPNIKQLFGPSADRNYVYEESELQSFCIAQ